MKFARDTREQGKLHRVDGGYQLTAASKVRCQRISTKFHSGIRTRYESAELYKLVISITRLVKDTWRAKAWIEDYEGRRTDVSLDLTAGPLDLFRNLDSFTGVKTHGDAWEIECS